MTVHHPVRSQKALQTIPEAVAKRVYEVYEHVFGAHPAMLQAERGYCGGFHAEEVVAMLYARSFPKTEWGRRTTEAMERQRQR
jgi:hypothetical protein